MLKSSIFIGVDVSKDKLDIYLNPTDEYLQIKNDRKGILSFIQKIKKRFKEDEYDIYVGMESTGRYHQLLWKELSLSCTTAPFFKVSIINPKRVSHFFRAYGDMAKTDKKDAKLISLYVEKIKPDITLYDKNKEALCSLVTRRHQMVESIKQQKTQIDQFKDNEDIYKSGQKMLKFLKQELLTIEEIITKTIEADEECSKNKEIMESMPGIGKVSSMVLTSYLPELGQINTKEVASLVGVAPKNKDSGQYKGKRMIQGGRMNVRNVLYMAAIAAIRHKNNYFYEFYNNLRNKGKPTRVALVAVIRKIVIILNAMVKNQEYWSNERMLKTV